MNCQECLNQLSTLSMREIPTSEAWKHSATCSECAQMIRVITETEAELALELDATQSNIPASYTARQAVRLATRLRVRSWVRILVSMVAIAAVWVVGQRLFFLRIQSATDVPAEQMQMVTLNVKCLKNEQAAELIRPYLQSRKSRIVIPSSELSVITVTGTPSEIDDVHGVMKQFDVPPGEKCAVPLPVPPP